MSCKSYHSFETAKLIMRKSYMSRSSAAVEARIHVVCMHLSGPRLGDEHLPGAMVASTLRATAVQGKVWVRKAWATPVVGHHQHHVDGLR